MTQQVVILNSRDNVATSLVNLKASCQLETRTLVDGIALVNLDRCFGCGNCTRHCEPKASRLRLKDKELLPPRDKNAQYMEMMSKKFGKWNIFKLRIKMLLGLKV